MLVILLDTGIVTGGITLYGYVIKKFVLDKMDENFERDQKERERIYRETGVRMPYYEPKSTPTFQRGGPGNR